MDDVLAGLGFGKQLDARCDWSQLRLTGRSRAKNGVVFHLKANSADARDSASHDVRLWTEKVPMKKFKIWSKSEMEFDVTL